MSRVTLYAVVTHPFVTPEPAMRAEALKLVDTITQSLSLLRRHL